MNYNFANKEERARTAKAHTEKMWAEHANEINESVVGSQVYGPFKTMPVRKTDNNSKMMNIQIFETDSVTAASMLQSKNTKTAILNFASYKNPGGMFINGSRAQEECLCHESYLYNVLSQFQYYYDWNKNNLNRGLYLNRGIYTPKVLFKEDFYADVITCAAPNYGVASKYQNVSKEENDDVLRSRIMFVLDMAALNNVNNIVLGAFGCGVFKQDPCDTAKIFKECLSQYNCFNNVIFAIPKGHDEQNLRAFQEVLC